MSVPLEYVEHENWEEELANMTFGKGKKITRYGDYLGEDTLEEILDFLRRYISDKHDRERFFIFMAGIIARDRMIQAFNIPRKIFGIFGK